MMLSTCGTPEEDLNQVIQEKGKVISQTRFQTPLRRNSDSSDEEDDNIVFRSNKDQVLVKIKNQLDQ